MDQDQLIKIIAEIKDFQYINRIGKSLKAQTNFFYDGKEEMKYHSFDAILTFYGGKNEFVNLGIYGWFPEVKTKGIYWQNFDNNIVEVLGSIFYLKIQTNRDGGKYADIEFQGKRLASTISIKQSIINNSHFLCIYYFDDGESRRNPQLYVHGIWEVELSEEFKLKLLS